MLNNKQELLFDFFNKNGIKYTLYKHNPVFTTQDKLTLIDSNILEIPGIHSKNLFLKTEKTNIFYLVSVTENKKVDLKALSNALNCNRFSFGKPEELLNLLNLTPGSVTPFGLMFDKNNQVNFVLDKDFLDAKYINFHPLVNNMTVGLAPQDFLTCMNLLLHKANIINIPVK